METTFRNTVFEVSLSALKRNYFFLKEKLNSKTKIMAVVKAFAYSHGGVHISNYLEKQGVDYLAVAFIDEGVAIRESGNKLPILVFNPNPEEFDAIVKYKLEPAVYNSDFLKAFSTYLAKNEIKNYPVHIKLDTGMHRSGFMEDTVDSLKTLLTKEKTIFVKSIFSHLAASEDLAEKTFTLKQLTLFEQLATSITTILPNKPLFHILNSAGIINYPEFQFDMVRLGKSLYGSSPLEEIQKKLEPVGSLKSVITQIRTIAKGETVSYNRKFKATEKTIVATIPIGYADGIDRRLGYGNGEVLINKKIAPIIGSVCMDSLMVDITNITAKITDEVLFFGKDYPVENVVKKLNTVTYEVFTNVSKRVKRVYIK